MSSSFTFCNDIIDGLMMDKLGIHINASTGSAEHFNLCCDCRSFLSKCKILRLALANNLYRGTLPNQFADLTWVEEKVCALYCITVHVTCLFQSSDPAQPRVFHGNTCAHEMNTVSTVTVLPRTPSDVNAFLSIVFIGPEKFDPKRMGMLFHVCRQKIWSFLMWLHHHNALYAQIPLDSSIVSLYPDDGPIPGLADCVIEDHELNANFVFEEETAGFGKHLAGLFTSNAAEGEQMVMIEKMGVSDPESDKLTGQSFVASAIRNLLPKDTAESRPDLVIHNSG
jgi:hypothetical protein